MVEVFSAQGNNPVAKWKLQGAPASIKKVSSHVDPSVNTHENMPEPFSQLSEMIDMCI